MKKIIAIIKKVLKKFNYIFYLGSTDILPPPLSKEEENEYFIELYPYTYQSNSSDLLKLDADKTHMTLYLNNEKYDAYGIKSNYDNSKYIYIIFLPKNIILTKDNTGIIFQDKENNIQSCYTIDEIKQKIKDCYATVLSYIV